MANWGSGIESKDIERVDLSFLSNGALFFKKNPYNSILNLTSLVRDAILICVTGFLMPNHGG